MKIEEIAEAFQTLEDDARKCLLGSLAFYLTVAARAAYTEAQLRNAEAIDTLIGLNEVIHRVSAQQNGLLCRESKGYPDSDFWQIVREGAQSRGVSEQVQWAVSQAWEAVQSDPSF